MLKLMGKNIITILHSKSFLIWTYELSETDNKVMYMKFERNWVNKSHFSKWGKIHSFQLLEAKKTDKEPFYFLVHTINSTFPL